MALHRGMVAARRVVAGRLGPEAARRVFFEKRGWAFKRFANGWKAWRARDRACVGPGPCMRSLLNKVQVFEVRVSR